MANDILMHALTLGEIATWWDRRTCASVEIVEAGPGAYRPTLSGPEGLALTVRRPRAAEGRGLGPDEIVRSEGRPVVGLDEGASADLRNAVRQLGYFYEITSDRDRCNMYVGREVPATGVEDVIARCPGPLLADSRWPTPFGLKQYMRVAG